MFEGFDGWLSVDQPAKTGMSEPVLTVTQFVSECNLSLAADFGDILLEGEVASFKVSQGKWVFFDLKEDDTSVGCFMVLSQLSVAIADGMKVRVRATPKLTRWGKFSLTVSRIQPVGEGSIKKSFELLKKKLEKEGLFAPERKRPLPEHITKIGIISSTNAAGYADFIKILGNRWGGLEIKVINTQVQGLVAPAQITRALNFFNEHGGVDIIAIIRGGGSADDLAAFNDEELVRAIVASRIPVITGIGHEVDESLADLAADIRASTPSNAAERLTPDKSAIVRVNNARLEEAKRTILKEISYLEDDLDHKLLDIKSELLAKISRNLDRLAETKKVLEGLNPDTVLKRGYAIISKSVSPGGLYSCGDEIEVITSKQKILAEVKNAQSIKR